MTKVYQYEDHKYDIILDNGRVHCGAPTPELAMKSVPTMEEIFHGKFVRLDHRVLLRHWWIHGEEAEPEQGE